MKATNNIKELVDEVTIARSRFQESDGIEWVRLVLALKTLSKTYRTHDMYDKAVECDRESNQILYKIQERTVSPVYISGDTEPVLDLFDETYQWVEKVEESRKDLENGGSPIIYAKTINALCEYLCMSGQSQIALLKYEEALHILLSKAEGHDLESEQAYLIIVILLKASECALDLGKELLSRSYSVYPLLYLAENVEKEGWNSSYINWSYVADLCKSLINKQQKYENR